MTRFSIGSIGLAFQLCNERSWLALGNGHGLSVRVSYATASGCELIKIYAMASGGILRYIDCYIW